MDFREVFGCMGQMMGKPCVCTFLLSIHTSMRTWSTIHCTIDVGDTLCVYEFYGGFPVNPLSYDGSDFTVLGKRVLSLHIKDLCRCSMQSSRQHSAKVPLTPLSYGCSVTS